MKRLAPCLFLAVLVTIPAMAVFAPGGYAFAQSPADYMNRGNAAYRAGDYGLAIELYKTAGVENAGLFYNRANAHFKKGEIGLAIVYYIRAQRIMPRDTDIRSNLDYARKVRADRLETEKEPWALAAAVVPYRMLSMNEHAFAALFLFTFLLALLAFNAGSLKENVKVNAPLKIKGAAIVVAVLLCAQVAVTGMKTYNEKGVAHAVAMVDETTAFSAPSTDSDKVFKLHEGIEMIRKRGENGFALIVLPTGWTGWIPEEALEII
ncbi:MAG: hypothetical protein V3S46_09005 [Nitrospinota bacterium]